jgi:predicted DNA repair protein MutK
MTVGVYGLVAGIVKLDDFGLYLHQKGGTVGLIGALIVRAAPWLMKALSVLGTAAMFLVGGSILTHGVKEVAHAIQQASVAATALPGVGTVLGPLTPMLLMVWSV